MPGLFVDILNAYEWQQNVGIDSVFRFRSSKHALTVVIQGH